MWNNVENCYRAGKRLIHIPSEKGQYVGRQVRELLADYPWDAHYRHLGQGGQIAVLHAHRPQAWFAVVDLAGFYVSVRRNMVAAALRRAGVRQARHFAKWSTVKAEGGGYVLPLGFPASTHLATLVMQESPLGGFLRAAAGAVTVQVYLDDISLSADDRELLADVFAGLPQAAEASGFRVAAGKSSGPARRIELLGCVLEQGRAVVGKPGQGARFERYCRAVEEGNRLDGETACLPD